MEMKGDEIIIGRSMIDEEKRVNQASLKIQCPSIYNMWNSANTKPSCRVVMLKSTNRLINKASPQQPLHAKYEDSQIKEHCFIVVQVGTKSTEAVANRFYYEIKWGPHKMEPAPGRRTAQHCSRTHESLPHNSRQSYHSHHYQNTKNMSATWMRFYESDVDNLGWIVETKAFSLCAANAHTKRKYKLENGSKTSSHNKLVDGYA
ncbi:hypothetical protein Lal_00024574 [Lupinus albus]|nr:hypothetical protein Lal_00024574 [Lupinus albus]